MEADTPRNYALASGLSVDCHTETLNRVLQTVKSLQETVPAFGRGELTSFRHLTECTIPSPNISEDDALDLEAEQFMPLLPEILYPPCDLYLSPPRSRRAEDAKRLKLELPILRSNHNVDVLRQQRDIAAMQDTSLNDHHLPLDPVDNDIDEGLVFPGWTKALLANTNRCLEKESLEHLITENDSEKALEVQVRVDASVIEDLGKNIADDEFKILETNRVGDPAHPSVSVGTNLSAERPAYGLHPTPRVEAD